MGGASAQVRYIQGTNEYGTQSEVKVSASGHIPVIQYGHRAAHEDGMCVASYYDSDVDTSAPLLILVQTDTAWELHSHFRVTASGGLKSQLYEHESSAISSTGTAMTVARFNRESTVADTDRVFTYRDATESSAGVLLMEAHNGGSTAPRPVSSPIGGSQQSGEEFIFPENSGKSYLIKLTPDGDNTKISFMHEYYEVVPES